MWGEININDTEGLFFFNKSFIDLNLKGQVQIARRENSEREREREREREKEREEE